MTNYKSLLKFGGTFSALGLTALMYNFIAMYDIAAKCPVSVKAQPCQTYDNWQLINQIGTAIIVLGFLLIVTGFLMRGRSKH